MKLAYASGCVRESPFYKAEGDRLRCIVCERRCLIPDGKFGFCGSRVNRDGKMYTLTYGNVSSISVNPIEKKPLYHFYPGTYALTVGTWGCNFTCPWCLPQGEVLLTRGGVAPVEEVYSKAQNGEKVEVFTHKGRFRRVVRAFKHPFNGYLVAFKPAYLNQYIHVTPGHNILVRRDGEIRELPARLLQRGDMVLVPLPREAGITPFLKIVETALQSLGPYSKKKGRITGRPMKEAKAPRMRVLSWQRICRRLGLSDQRRVVKHDGPNFQCQNQHLLEGHGKARITYGRGWLPHRVGLEKDLAGPVGKEVYLSDAGRTESMLSLIEDKEVQLYWNVKHGMEFGALDGEYLYIEVRDIKSVPYAGPVYNFEVEQDHTYTTPFVAVSNCQNYSISKVKAFEAKCNYLSPEEFIELALDNGCEGTSISFNEPTLMVEWSLDVFRLAKKEGLYNTFVTNGYMTPEVVKALVDAGLDAANIDVKGCSREVAKYCAGDVEVVWRNAVEMKRRGVHVEITTLVIPNVNDDLGCLARIARRIKEDLGEFTPWHLTRYFPAYRFGEPPTPISALERAREAGLEEGLRYVYIGNVSGHRYENTYCHGCGALLIKRVGLTTTSIRVSGGACPDCGTRIPIIMKGR